MIFYIENYGMRGMLSARYAGILSAQMAQFSGQIRAGGLYRAIRRNEQNMYRHAVTVRQNGEIIIITRESAGKSG